MQEPISVDYLGLRKLYESREDQKRLDEIIVTYLSSQQFKIDEKEYIAKGKHIPFLDGIRISEKTIRSLSFQNTLVLLLNDVEPQTALKRAIFEKDEYHEYEYISILNRFGKLSSEQLERAILDTDKMKASMPQRIFNIVKVMSGNREEYNVDFSRLESALTDYLIKLDEYMEEKKLGDRNELIETIFRFLMEPYNDSHVELVKFLNRYMTAFPSDSMFLCRDLLNRLMSGIETMSELVDLFHSRKDLTVFAKSIKNLAKYWMFKSEKSKVEQLFNEIIEGKCKRVGFALLLFPKLNERRNEIINAWIRSERTLELDIYLESLLSNKFDLSSYPNTAFDFAENSDNAHVQNALQEDEKGPKRQ